MENNKKTEQNAGKFNTLPFPTPFNKDTSSTCFIGPRNTCLTVHIDPKKGPFYHEEPQKKAPICAF